MIAKLDCTDASISLYFQVKGFNRCAQVDF